jgi:hypothetical protein
VGYRVLVAVIVAVHFAFLLEVIAGGFLALWRRWLIWVHLAAVAWAVAILTVPGLVCPLTVAENWARKRAGMASYSGGFIDRYIQGHLYPAAGTHFVQAAIGAVVVLSWVLLYRGTRRT